MYAEIKVPSFENQELTNVPLLKPGAEQNIATHASPIARNLSLVLISAVLVQSPWFFSAQILPQLFTVLQLIQFSVWAHKRFKQFPC